MAPKRSMTSSQIASKGGKIAKELETLMSEKKKEQHRRRFDAVLERIKEDSELCERVSTAVENNLLTGTQTKEPETFGPKCFTLNRVGKNFLKTFLADLSAPGFSANELRSMMSKDSDLVNQIFRYVCKVEMNYFIGPQRKSEWLEVFKARYSSCGRLLHSLHFDGNKINWSAAGHYKMLPAVDSAASADLASLAAHKFTEIECHGIRAPLPEAVSVTAAWTLANNYSLVAAEVRAPGDLGFSFNAKVCFKGVKAFDDMVSAEWLSEYDQRGKKGSVGAKAEAEENASDAEEDAAPHDEQAPPEPTPKKQKLAPPKTTPEKLNVLTGLRKPAGGKK